MTGFGNSEVAVVRDAGAGPKFPEGDGYLAVSHDLTRRDPCVEFLKFLQPAAS
jgi:hypothetical protein